MTNEILKKYEHTTFIDKLNVMKEWYKVCKKREKESVHYIHETEQERARIGGYLTALRDTETITERERQILFVYFTN